MTTSTKEECNQLAWTIVEGLERIERDTPEMANLTLYEVLAEIPKCSSWLTPDVLNARDDLARDTGSIRTGRIMAFKEDREDTRFGVLQAKHHRPALVQSLLPHLTWRDRFHYHSMYTHESSMALAGKVIGGTVGVLLALWTVPRLGRLVGRLQMK